jgi:hypothetical protein
LVLITFDVVFDGDGDGDGEPGTGLLGAVLNW